MVFTIRRWIIIVVILDLKERTAVLKEKKTEHLEVGSEIEDKEHHKELLIQRIETLKKNQAKNKECMLNFLFIHFNDVIFMSM